MPKNKKKIKYNIFLPYRLSHTEIESEKKKKTKNQTINSRFKHNRAILPKCFLGWCESVQSHLFSPLHPVPLGCTRMANPSTLPGSWLLPLTPLCSNSLHPFFLFFIYIFSFCLGRFSLTSVFTRYESALLCQWSPGAAQGTNWRGKDLPLTNLSEHCSGLNPRFTPLQLAA